MIYGSICSGIEAATVAWEPLGWKAAWFSEIEAFPSAVLQERWPEVVNLGDMTKIAAAVRAGEVQAPDVMVGGTPCQAFSIAGLRNGLADARGQLTLSYVELANAIDDKRIERGEEEAIFVWENVPGVLTSHDNAFGCFLAGLAGESCELEPSGGKWSHSGCVYGPQRTIAWIVKDAQYFGVAQRRKRVFVVASARKGFDPGQVLFESEGVRRDTPPSREPQTAVAALTARGVGTCGADDNQAQAGHIIAECANGDISHTLKAEGFDGSEDGTGRGIPAIAFGGGNTSGNIDIAACLTARGQRIDFDVETFAVHGTQDPDTNRELAHTLGRNHGQENAISNGMLVRRLTPVECERLQGFPDNHTLISWRGKEATECPDGPRYRAIGNSMAVPVMRWIGERIAAALPAKKS
ncbi:TPA: DNA cytosine methyltransferase, partial [Klebsiella oxytoca]|nr:DNA cytosine methyltransferase [Klebsiella oxytoca]